MVDSRAKGRKAETDAKAKLRQWTGLKWERIPGSGALDAVHGLKGDLYIPKVANRFCVEVKHYKEDHFTTKLLTSAKPQFLEWWEQAERQGKQTDKLPLLLFKHDRSKWFVAIQAVCILPKKSLAIMIDRNITSICLLEDFCEENPDIWIIE